MTHLLISLVASWSLILRKTQKKQRQKMISYVRNDDEAQKKGKKSGLRQRQRQRWRQRRGRLNSKTC